MHKIYSSLMGFSLNELFVFGYGKDYSEKYFLGNGCCCYNQGGYGFDNGNGSSYFSEATIPHLEIDNYFNGIEMQSEVCF